ncbi:hypothetical protein OCV51_07980 [Faecalicatena acetigenes]|uniref:Uncharacterized protein n=1 Tax=Faecalicatena acetigenes TaxID=2981790 RepID=A0ABT2TBD5_9FIRM|nr:MULTISPECIES: hypothetical protein [Lachnospiraceae]MCU6747593.1 hypothetical protein [Faecalicatena acetigenes]RGT73151.1 hypothetical protein DWX08_07020 [Ruminococcus sp. AF18-22]SCH98192.1 Uncharacterised protein [uncultured Clostridium sp.]
MYKGLWKLTERYTERETGVSVYLATLILLWTALAIFAGVFVCAAEKKDIVKCLADIVCTGAYAGIIFGLCGGIFFLCKHTKI